MNSIWSRHGDEIKQLRDQGYTLQQLADKFGCTKERMRQLLKKYRGTTKVPMLSEHTAVKALRCDGKALRELRAEGLLNPIRINNFVYYTEEEIEKARKLLEKYCKACGKPVSRKKTLCSECFKEHGRNFRRELYKRKIGGEVRGYKRL